MLKKYEMIEKGMTIEEFQNELKGTEQDEVPEL